MFPVAFRLRLGLREMATAGLLLCELAAFCALQLPSANTLYAHIFRAEEIA